MANVLIPASCIKPGMTYMTHYGPRAVKSVGTRDIDGRKCFLWTWDKQPRLDGGMDCGYGGVAIERAHEEMMPVAAA